MMFKNWHDARAYAQAKANTTGKDHGIEWNHVYNKFSVFGLPGVPFRFGHELACEVVLCENEQTCKPGHGPAANIRLP